MARFSLAALLAAALLFAAGLYGQVTSGEILGVVRDASGAAVPNAAITVKNLDTNAARDSATGSDGRFRVPLLPPGNYEVRVGKPGFATYVQGPIVLRLNQSADLDVKLQVAGVNEAVTVIADAALINTTNAEIGANFDVKRVSELPLAPNHNILNLALSVAGVSQLSGGNSTFATGGQSFAVNGMRTRSNNFMIDGSDSNQPSITGLAQQINNPDMVAEFRLITNQFAAEYGRTAGSVVNIVTKSGTNEFHGSLFWFYNGNALNARSNLDKRTFTKAPWRVQDQFGGTVGGPIIKNKTFFFGSLLRWTDHRFASGTSITGAPTSDGQTILRDIAGTRPQVQALLANLPPAQTAIGQSLPVTVSGRTVQVPIGTLSGAAANVTDVWQWSGRIDHRISAKHNLGGRYLFDDRVAVSGQAVPPGLTGQSPERRQALSVFLNSSLTPRLYNELRLSLQRYVTKTFAADTKSLNIPSIEVSSLGLTGFNAADSRTAIGLAVNYPQGAVYNTYQLQDTLGYIRGTHAFKAGIDFRRVEQFTDFNPTVRGRVMYTTLQNFVDDVAQTGAINSFQPGVNPIQPYRYYDYSFFAQDEWHARQDLTFTYGIRYETPGNAVGTLLAIDQKILAANNNNPAYGLGAVPNRDRNNWAPRFGFNYRFGEGPGILKALTGSGKLVLRGGYSRTYDLAFNNIFLNMFSAFPFQLVTTLAANTPNSFVLVDGIRSGKVAPVNPSNPLLVTRTNVTSDFRSPLAEQFSVQFQRELGKDWALSTGWVGTKGTALFQSIDGNPTIAGANAGGTIRVDGTRGVIRTRCNCASSVYHSWQTSLEKRLSKDFSMATHFTWSSFIDNASEVFNPSVAGEIAVSQDSFNRRRDRGRSTYDRPLRLAVNGVYEVRFMRAQKGVVGHIVGGWQLSGFLSLQSGAPFSPLNGSDPGFRLSGIDGLIGSAIRPNLNTSLNLAGMSLEDIVSKGGRTLFSAVTAGNPLGNAGRNILRADGINNVDFGINKNIRVMEGQRLQIRAEFYDAFNSRDFGIPQAAINNAGFGLQWNTDGGNRRIVMGLRYTF
jgi:hypothetical protein